MLLLDTHAWIWTVEGNERRIGRQARRLIARADSDGTMCLSPATLFETTALHAAGRLRLARPLEHWLHAALNAGHLRIAELSAAVAVDAGQILRAALADPMDRLLVATARQIDATFLTSDRQILEYAARTRNVRVHDASR